jgi:hypothetical protein
MIETLVGGVFGGLLRMVPEVLKWLDRKDDRAHELSMFDKQLAADKLRADAQQIAFQTQADTMMNTAELAALISATEAQGKLTGVRWVDAISSLMRPLITFWWVIVMYSTALIARFCVLVQSGSPGIEAIVMLWGTDEKAIVMSIISFWFMDRTLRK